MPELPRRFLAFSDGLQRHVDGRDVRSRRPHDCWPLKRYSIFPRYAGGSGVSCMKLQEWLRSELEYSHDLVNSAMDGARYGCQRAIADEPAREVFANAARKSVPLAAVGACVVTLAVHGARKRISSRSEMLCGMLGALIGFSAGIALSTRP